MRDNLKPCILVVDDETSIRESFSLILQDNYNVVTAASGEAALKKIVDTKIDLTFLDIRMPGMDGMETLKMIKKMDDTIEVIMVTAVNDVQKAGEAIQFGANNYIVKPFDVEQILVMTKALVGRKYLKDGTRSIREEAAKKVRCPQLTGTSKAVLKLNDQIETLSQADSPVLISGAEGAEIGCVAYMIHSKSPRSPLPFRHIDLSLDMSDELLLALLFGSGRGSNVYEMEKGTGAFEEATGGTVFLNNIDSASHKLQETIMESIQNKEIKRLGSNESIPVNIRVLAGTSKDLKALCDQGAFNPELFDLLNPSTVHVPSLNERKDDIISVASALMENYSTRYNRPVKEMSADAQEILLNYDWPGNSAELEGIIRRIALSANSETVNCRDLPLNVLLRSKAVAYVEETGLLADEELTNRFEKEFIPYVLKKVNFDIKNASSILNISPSNLSSKIESIEIS